MGFSGKVRRFRFTKKDMTLARPYAVDHEFESFKKIRRITNFEDDNEVEDCWSRIYKSIVFKKSSDISIRSLQDNHEFNTNGGSSNRKSPKVVLKRLDH